MKLGGDQLRVHGEVVGVAVRGPWIAVASRKMVALFDRATGIARWRVGVRQFSAAFSVAISHDLETVAIGEFGVRIVDAGTGAERWSRHLGSSTKQLEFSADDAALLVCGHNRVWLLDPRSGEEQVRPMLEQATRAAFGGHGIVFPVDYRMKSVGPDGVVHDLGPLVSCATAVTRGGVIADQSSRVIFTDLEGAERQTIPISTAYEGLEAAHPAGDRIAMRHDNGEVWLLDDRGGIRVIASAMAAAGAVGVLDDDTLVIGARDGTVSIIDLASDTRRTASPPPPTSLAFASDATLACAGPLAATGTSRGPVHAAMIRELAGGTVIAELGAFERVTAEGDRIVAWGERGARLFDLAGRFVSELATTTVSSVAISATRIAIANKTEASPCIHDRDGRLLRTLTGNGTVIRYSGSSHGGGWASDDPAYATAMAWLGPERLLVYFDQGVIVFEGDARTTCGYASAEVVFALDDRLIIGSGSKLECLAIVDGVPGPALWVRDNTRPLAAAGNRVAISVDGEILLLDTAAGDERARHATHLWQVLAVAFDPTGALIASAADDGALVVRQLSGAW